MQLRASFPSPQGQCRRNLFPQERRNVVSRSSRTQPQHPTSSFYNRVTTVTESPDHWQPGEYIPTHSSPNPTVDFHTLLSEMQSSISSELSKMQGTLSIITNRLEKLEDGVAVNTAKLSSPLTRSTPHSTPSSSSCESSGGGVVSRKRKRRVPTGLSVSVNSL